jgi:hypothetical protein
MARRYPCCRERTISAHSALYPTAKINADVKFAGFEWVLQAVGQQFAIDRSCRNFQPGNN